MYPSACQDRGVESGARFFRKCALEGGSAERKEMIDPENKLSVQKQARLLKISRSSVYYKPQPFSADAVDQTPLLRTRGKFLKTTNALSR